MLAQYILTALVVAAAVAYAAWRIYDRLKHADRCRGCALMEQCHKRNGKHRPLISRKPSAQSPCDAQEPSRNKQAHPQRT